MSRKTPGIPGLLLFGGTELAGAEGDATLGQIVGG